MTKCRVTLCAEERQLLQGLIADGEAAAKKLAHARILLKADAAESGPAWPDVRIAEALEVSTDTVGRVRQRFVEQGLEAALVRKPQARPSRQRTLHGRAEARAHRSGRLHPARGPQGVDHADARRSADRVGGRPLGLRQDRAAGSQENELRPHFKQQWCIPPEANAEFVCRMEDVPEVYHRPYDEKRPLVCLDEASKQLVGEVIEPIPAEPGQPERFDSEYTRNGTADLFMISEPLLGWRAVKVTERPTAVDFAEVVRWLVEEVHAEAEKVVLVMDNLNTHKLASLYEAFPPERARRIA
jgi:hypothetical protein